MYEWLGSFIRKFYPQCPVDVALVDPFLETKQVDRGDYLFHEGDICNAVGITKTGCLRSFFLKEGKEITLFFHPEQQTLGDYESMRRHQPACLSCQAVEDSSVLMINNQALEVLEALPNGQKLLRLVVEDLAFGLRDRLLTLYRDSAEQRYLKFINTEPALLRRIPQHYLASYLGIEPESLSRLKRRIQTRRS
ncbi:Crp/Fnr family transcriptional regulator [Acaryochloris sp. IP29b_bin.137]|uniref:Crp/Fnr family transcriptional regulator n=1 Tax=Acaryochloris sp. IP29b_bin.137 TaxID=2969217 RepID=UPI0026099E34|nr:Crp/Fnr family transcriptional regulator [Acaryochloris sp. IP29b_bin.137]